MKYVFISSFLFTGKTLETVVSSIARTLIENGSKLNELDSGVGDGDSGSTHTDRQGAIAVQEALDY